MSYLVPGFIRNMFARTSPAETIRDIGTKEELKSDFIKRVGNVFSEAQTTQIGESIEFAQETSPGALAAAKSLESRVQALGTEKREAFFACIDGVDYWLYKLHGNIEHPNTQKPMLDCREEYRNKLIDLEVSLDKSSTQLSRFAKNEKVTISFLHNLKKNDPDQYRQIVADLAEQTENPNVIRIVEFLADVDVEEEESLLEAKIGAAERNVAPVAVEKKDL